MVMQMVYLFLADGFEMIEALTPVDILRRAGQTVTVTAVGESLTVKSSHGIPVTADRLLCDVPAPAPGDMLILPGGMPGAENLYACEILRNRILLHSQKGGMVAAICAAPMILGRLGLLRGRKATCFPGFEKELTGAFVSPGRVVRDGNLLTARGMGVALPFALEAAAMLVGEDKARAIAASVMAE